MGRAPEKAKAKAKLAVVRKSPKNEGSRVRDLEMRLAAALEERDALSEILQVISRSPNDAQPVFDAIVASAVRLLGGYAGGLTRVAGDQVQLAAFTSTDATGDAAVRRGFPQLLQSEFLHPRVIRERAPLNIVDARTDPRMPEAEHTRARVRGYRSLLGVPLRRQDEAIGAISVSRVAAGGFTNDEIALLQTFADQAVIAIENARLFKETKEALEQQTVTAEILSVISRSPTDIQPVLEAVAQNASRLCGAANVSLYRVEGNLIRKMAEQGPPLTGLRVGETRPITRTTVSGRAIVDRTTIHVPDHQSAEAAQQYPDARRDTGIRTTIGIPLLREGVAIGAFTAYRTESRLFSEREIALLQTFADQAVIAIENVRLFNELADKNRALTESLEQQTATADILQVISRSPTEVEPVFEAVVASAARLCEAHDVAMLLVDGDDLRLSAGAGPLYMSIPADFRIRLTRGSAATRAVVDRATVHIHDFAAEPEEEYPVGRELARRFGHRSMLAVPLLREGVPIGVICAFRLEVRPFPDQQIALLRAFADQAVIAIENVRLFTELQASNRELTESLKQQTATAEILRVISSSRIDLQPVFDTIVQNAVELCGAAFGGLHRLERGGGITLDAQYGVPADELLVLQRDVFPLPMSRESATGRAMLDRAVVHIRDIRGDSDFRTPRLKTMESYRTILAVPLIREGIPVGALALWRREVQPFSDTEIGLVQTFADQAVIAIENVRLFTELEARNRDLTTALDQQTATSEILRVISSSPTDEKPVFDAIARSSGRLCGAAFSVVAILDADEMLHLVASEHVGLEGRRSLAAAYPMRPIRGQLAGRAILDRAVVHVADVTLDPEYVGAALGNRATLSVPMLRKGKPIGTITIGRFEPVPFTDQQIELLQTFADQAVIAIENVRLFKELEARTHDLTRSVGELRALGEVGQAISSTLDLRTVLSTIVTRATQLSGTDAGVIYEYDEQREVFLPRATEHLEAEIVETMLATPVRKGEGATGQLAEAHEPIQVPDILAAPAESRVRGALVRAGYRALLAVPFVREDHLIGGLTVIRKATGEFAPEVIDLMRTFATQSALAIQNARLFLEIEDKSQQLEAASQHKSEFLANMSHELRTPLNAIIGFSEVLTERMFGELNEKQDEYLKDIYASGQHLLSLINDILDLSKIEAGRMELEPTDFDLPSAIDNALTLVRERAGRRGITLGREIGSRVGMIRGDERKVKQVLLNLLSNALKFTPEGGRIDVRATANTERVEVSVADTGVGIAPEDQEAVFEEFRQVGTADKKIEGTGLGLALSRKFIELHGGRISVTSQMGAGSTFTFTIPVRREPRDRGGAPTLIS